MRTKEWKDAIVADRTFGGVRAMVVEPGDATRYAMLFTDVPGTVAEVVDLRECYLVTCTNLVYGKHASSMFVRPGQLVTWRDVRDQMGVTAAGSCQLIAELCAHVVGSRCVTWEQFESDYARYVEERERARLEKRSREEDDCYPDEATCKTCGLGVPMGATFCDVDCAEAWRLAQENEDAPLPARGDREDFHSDG